MSRKRYEPPAFKSNPELAITRDEILYLGLKAPFRLKELAITRDEILYLGLKAPFRLKELASQLSKEAYDIIYEHAIQGRHFAHIGRDTYYTEATVTRKWQRAVWEYHKKFKEVPKE